MSKNLWGTTKIEKSFDLKGIPSFTNCGFHLLLLDFLFGYHFYSIMATILRYSKMYIRQSFEVSFELPFQRLSFFIPSFYRHKMDKLTFVLMSIK